MHILAEIWIEALCGFIGAILLGALFSALENKHNGKDWRPCARFGAKMGILTGVFSILTTLIPKLLQHS